MKILIPLLCPNQIKKISSEYDSNKPNEEDILAKKEEETTSTSSNIEKGYSLNNNIKIWEAVISCLEAIFKQVDGGFKNLDKHILDDLIRSCQEMEIQMINFIVNNLLPNSFKIPKSMQNKLLTLLDLGSVFDYHNTQSKSGQPVFTSISRVFISNLFELCKYKTEESFINGKHETNRLYF